MKKLILKINYLFILIGFFGVAQTDIYGNEKLKGKIKTVESFVIEYGNKEKPVFFQNFDTMGRPLIVKKYNEGYLRSEERNEYKSNQIITTLCESCGNDFDRYFSKFSIKENEKYPDSGFLTNDPSVRQKIYKTVDKSGNIISEKYYTVNGYLTSTIKSSYNPKSKIISSDSYDEENKLYSSNKYLYNKSNFLTEEINKNENIPETKKSYLYDHLGRMILEKQNYNNTIYETSFEYIKVNDTTKILRYSSNSKGEKRLFEIELSYPTLKGETKEKQNISNNKVVYKTVFQYDLSKNLNSQKYYNDKNELIRESYYTYDKYGNWTEINISETVNVIVNNTVNKEIQKKQFIRRIQYY